MFNDNLYCLDAEYRGVGTCLADPATAGPKFTLHQESPQLILYINSVMV